MPPPKKVAAVVTVYHKWSHADVILRNLLDGYPPDGSKRPGMQLVSLYTDQTSTRGCMARGLAQKHGFRLAESISDALTLGTGTLAVDGVLSIAEHGKYPNNEKGQELYPRRRFFGEIAAVFEKAGKSVPVFSDKHLSAEWADAKWVYDRARQLFVPFLAGSSLPVTWRKPDLVLPKGCDLVGGLAIGYGPFEAYGFHALEALQCMVERRKGGETGVKAVTAHPGKSMWPAIDRHPWAKAVLEEALTHVQRHAKGDIRDSTANGPRRESAGAIEVEYRDGFTGLVVMPNGWVYEGDWGAFIFAGQVRGKPPEGCLFQLYNSDPFAHFAKLTEAIDRMMQTGHAPYPVERTLLTTGILDAAMTSVFRKGARVETPHLGVKYEASDWPPARGEMPPLVKR